MDVKKILSQLAHHVNANARLCWRGRHVSTAFLLVSGQEQFLVTLHNGCVQSVTTGIFQSTDWRFALHAAPETWATFWQALPPPGYHDIMAMLKFKHLKMEGDLYPLMSHLLYFKDLLASVRAKGAHA